MNRHFIFILRDPGAGNEGGADNQAEIDALEAALLEEDGGQPNADKKEDKEVGKDKADDKPASTDSKGKTASPAAGDDDPEHEIDLNDDTGKPVKSKVKLSELKKGYLRESDYTKKAQRVAEVEKNQKDLLTTIEAIRQNPKLAKLFVGLVEGAITKDAAGNGQYNEAFIDKQLGYLQGVQPEGSDTKKDLQDKNEDIEELLKEVDPDSPIAKALRQTYASNKLLMADLKGLKEQVGKTTTAIEARATQEQEAQYKTLVDGAGKMMNEHLDGMTDAAKADALEFFTDSEKQEWRYRVVAFLRDNPVDYKDEKDFVARIDQVGKSIHSYMVQYREGILAKQLEGNRKPKKEVAQPNNQSAEATTFEQDLEAELKALEGDR